MGSVKSSVTVGHVADGEKVAIAVEGGEDNGEEKRSGFESVVLCKFVDEFEVDRNMFSAADVKLATGLAVGGS